MSVAPGQNGTVPELAAIDVDTPELRKARGAFFTPDAIAGFIADWAVRDASDRVLEPSCGDAAFLVQAVDRLRALEPETMAQELFYTPPRVDGVEIHADSARTAAERVRTAGGDPNIVTNDFFLVEPKPEYTAVIGNPPYVRYQDWTGEARTRSREAALRAGVPLSGLASSWAAFTVQSAMHLKKGGRLGLVLPAELLSTNYAAPVRQFLFDRFASVKLVLFAERVFPEAETEVVLLLADGWDQGPTDHARIVQTQNAAGLSSLGVAQEWKPLDPSEKWTPSLLSPETLGVYAGLLASGDFVGLETWGDTTLGMVTGNNKFFTMSDARIKDNKIPASELIRLSPPGSAHLRGLSLTTAALNELARNGAATWLWRPSGDLSARGDEYRQKGEDTGVDQAYKCRVRTPWWRVPLVKPADLFLTYMNADTPRLTTNEARAYHLNSVHGVYLRSEYRTVGRQSLPLASVNSMTLLGAEQVGRAYGGGMLKIEPREADLLPVPAPAVVAAAAEKLALIRPQVGAQLRRGRLTDAAKLVDDVLLVGELGMKRSDVKHLREAHAHYSNRRTTRGRSVKD